MSGPYTIPNLLTGLRIALIPVIVVLFYLLRRVTEAELRELLIMVVISRVVGVAAVMFLGTAL